MAGAGLALAAAGAAVPAVWLGTVSLVAGIGVAAAGLGATFVAATTTALARVEHHEARVTSGTVNTFHEFGRGRGCRRDFDDASVDLERDGLIEVRSDVLRISGVPAAR